MIYTNILTILYVYLINNIIHLLYNMNKRSTKQVVPRTSQQNRMELRKQDLEKISILPIFYKTNIMYLFTNYTGDYRIYMVCWYI
jgi:hypothetical protein